MEENKNIGELLKAGIVKFSYAKTTGEERIAFGTLKEDLIPANKSQLEKYRSVMNDTQILLDRVYDVMEKETLQISEYREAIGDIIEGINTALNPKKDVSGRSMHDGLQLYYDFEAQGFRSFKKEQLLKVF